MVDLDNDGLPDLFLVTGGVYPEVEQKLPAYPFRTPRLVFRNLGDGKFEELIDEAGTGVAAAHTSRGCAFGDFDNDGDVDILVMNMNEPPSLLRNDVSGNGHWLKVLLIGVQSNRSAIGARVVARYGNRTQAQEVTAQSSFYSANDRRLHFGLGTATAADVTIRWPNGDGGNGSQRRGGPARRHPGGSRDSPQTEVQCLALLYPTLAGAVQNLRSANISALFKYNKVEDAVLPCRTTRRRQPLRRWAWRSESVVPIPIRSYAL